MIPETEINYVGTLAAARGYPVPFASSEHGNDIKSTVQTSTTIALRAVFLQTEGRRPADKAVGEGEIAQSAHSLLYKSIL